MTTATAYNIYNMLVLQDRRDSYLEEGKQSRVNECIDELLRISSGKNGQMICRESNKIRKDYPACDWEIYGCDAFVQNFYPEAN